MFSHVLVPLDFRFIPKITLMAAAVLANEQGAKLTLLYVSDIVTDFPAVAVTAITDEVVQREYDDIRRSFDNALAIIAEYGTTASAYVVNGFGYQVHEMIKNAAATIKADVIVMGTHGRRGLARAIRGSVTEQVLREADVPVLAIHESPTMTFTPISWEPYDSWTGRS
jgi:nucleotide-binding universal stress UspA family protein